MYNYKIKASKCLYFGNRYANNLSCLQCAVTVNTYTEVCLLHVFLHVQIYTKAHLSYACLELNVC